MMGAEGKLFEVSTPLGFTVSVTAQHWEKIVTFKHPIVAGREKDIQDTLENPGEIRRSSKDPDVNLFYRVERPQKMALCGSEKTRWGRISGDSVRHRRD